jgi:DNA-binding transcriptional MerR regulator/methylmalonyl-CoA mutase cobalamin-binding subunit
MPRSAESGPKPRDAEPLPLQLTILCPSAYVVDVAQSRTRRPAQSPADVPASNHGASRKAAADSARYSIRVTSRLTAIELDTLRMWERRYGFPRPTRTSSGSRVYTEADVEALKLIRRAIERGYRPGEIVGKPAEELAELIRVTSQAPVRTTSASPNIPSLVATLLRDDLAALHADLRQAAVILGPKRFLVEVAQPLSVRVGDLWAEGRLEVHHEHVLSECLSAQLRVLISAYEDRAGAPRVLLSTLPNERHALGLEMVQVYLALSEVTPILLGVDTPAEQIVKAARAHEADAVGLLVTRASDLKATNKQIRWMLGELPRRVAIWVGGEGGHDLGIRDDSLRLVATWKALDAAIATLARGE